MVLQPSPVQYQHTQREEISFFGEHILYAKLDVHTNLDREDGKVVLEFCRSKYSVIILISLYYLVMKLCVFRFKKASLLRAVKSNTSDTMTWIT